VRCTGSRCHRRHFGQNNAVVQPDAHRSGAKMTDEPLNPYSERIPPDFLDGSMTRSELVAVLEGIRFPRHGTKSIELDAAVHDYLLGLLRRA